MSKLSLISSLKEADLQIPEGQLTGGNLREAFRRLFAQLNPYFDGINKLASKGITLADNLNADVVTAKFSHGVAQQVLLKTLKRAGSALVVSAEGVRGATANVQMVQIPPGQKYGPLASVTVWFPDPASASISCALLLLADGAQTSTVPAPTDTWTALPYAANWLDYGTPWATAQYAKDASGFILLKGLAKYALTAGAGTVIGTLPAGFRVAANQQRQFACSQFTGAVSQYGQVTIKADGTINCDVFSATGNNVGNISLDGIAFDTR